MNEEARLSRLVAAGADRLDAPAVRMIAALLARAGGALPEASSRRLRERARGRLDLLEASLAASRAELASLRETLETLGPSATAALGADPGDARDAVRRLRARVAELDPAASARAFARVERAAALVASRGLRADEPTAARLAALRASGRVAEPEQRAAAHALATALGTEPLVAAVDRARASLAGSRLARRRAAEEQAGPYNPRALAARALERLGTLSPALLRAWWDLLEGAQALDRLDRAAPRARRR